MVVHSRFLFIISLSLSVVYSCLERFSKNKPKYKRHERELTTAEVIAVFAIAVSAICIFTLAPIQVLLNSIVFIIPMGIIVLAIRLLFLSKALAASQTSNPSAN